MTPVDYILIAVVFLSAVYGAVRGFLREVVALLTWVAALWAGWHYADLLTPYFGAIESRGARVWTARTLLVIAVLIVGTFVGVLAARVVRLSLFSGLDRLLGFLFGALRGLVVLGLAAIVAGTLHLDSERWWRQSLLIPYVELVASGVGKLVGERV